MEPVLLGADPEDSTMRAIIPDDEAAFVRTAASIVIILLFFLNTEMIWAIIDMAISCGVTALMGSPMGE